MRTPFFITSTYFQNIQNIIQGLFTWRRGTSGGRGKLWRFMYCKPDQIKMRDYMDRLVSPRKRRLPHLPGVPHLPVKTRPLFLYRRRNFGYLLFIQNTMLFLSFLIFFLLFALLLLLSLCLLLTTAISFESCSTCLQVSVELTNP